MKTGFARSALPKNEPLSRPFPCPGITEITFPYLLKSLSGNY